MPNKVIGYALLTLGLILILFSGFNVYQVFTGRANPIDLFKFDSVEIDTSQMISGSPNNSKTEIIPGDVLNETSNVFAHLFLMGFVASIGFKIGNLGVQLVRPIVVKLNQENDKKA